VRSRALCHDSRIVETIGGDSRFIQYRRNLDLKRGETVMDCVPDDSIIRGFVSVGKAVAEPHNIMQLGDSNNKFRV
jgi:hypothetical protein